MLKQIKQSTLIVASVLLAGLAYAVTFVPLVGEVSLLTSPDRRTATLTVSNGGSVTAQFCLVFPEPLDQAIRIAQPGQVIYLPQPIESLPPGAETTGREPIAKTVTVIFGEATAYAFVAKGVKPIDHNAQPIVISDAWRRDVPGMNNTQRDAGADACAPERS